MANITKITKQAAGAFGEKAVETELLRYGWIPANVNATVKNAAKYDIYAVKGDRSIQLRVKTCRPDMRAVVHGGFRPGEPITLDYITSTDFTIIVRMGENRQQDQFFVVPTDVVRREVAERQKERKLKGIKDIGMFRLSFIERPDGQLEAGTGIDKKWAHYKGRWDLLDRDSPT
jgi:hypothetical protein